MLPLFPHLLWQLKIPFCLLGFYTASLMKRMLEGRNNSTPSGRIARTCCLRWKTSVLLKKHHTWVIIMLIIMTTTLHMWLSSHHTHEDSYSTKSIPLPIHPKNWHCWMKMQHQMHVIFLHLHYSWGHFQRKIIEYVFPKLLHISCFTNLHLRLEFLLSLNPQISYPDRSWLQ